MVIIPAIIAVLISVVFSIGYIFFGEYLTNAIDNTYYSISQFGKHTVTNNELREKFKQHIDNGS